MIDCEFAAVSVAFFLLAHDKHMPPKTGAVPPAHYVVISFDAATLHQTMRNSTNADCSPKRASNCTDASCCHFIQYTGLLTAERRRTAVYPFTVVC